MNRVNDSWLRGYFDTLFKIRACLLVISVAMINDGNCFYSSEWYDITGLANWSDRDRFGFLV